jgi:uncharacterized protein YjiS (DUF1127 family)
MLCGYDLQAPIDPAPSGRAAARTVAQLGAIAMSSPIVRGLPSVTSGLIRRSAPHPKAGWNALIDGMRSAVRRWFARARQRRALRQLAERTDDYLLKDIGVTRDEAFREAEKPFWRR